MMPEAGVLEDSGQGWLQVVEFGVALLLSSLIGLEREIRQKAAGLRTYTTVGVGAALFTLVSKYGFSDVLNSGTVVLDPSRMAAQIVSGVGFIGAGMIFVHRGSVQGLTTAATIWLTAGVGAAAASGLPVLAALATASYFFVSYVMRPLAHRLSVLKSVPSTYRVAYLPRSGLPQELLKECERAGFTVTAVRTTVAAGEGGGATDLSGVPGNGGGIVELLIAVVGREQRGSLTVRLAEISGVLACARDTLNEE